MEKSEVQESLTVRGLRLTAPRAMLTIGVGLVGHLVAAVAAVIAVVEASRVAVSALERRWEMEPPYAWK